LEGITETGCTGQGQKHRQVAFFVFLSFCFNLARGIEAPMSLEMVNTIYTGPSTEYGSLRRRYLIDVF